ncbi:hypothetical protein PISMIDRAFT_681401 [Pisolithus microcarpus 441]|uniref:Uncharacterized protein n=1 Tax=Pisolithus microcarpus 441 TaxID=765257 RepID=A0A0C9Y9R6_9AGAM|nr:hypothetical protein BKA83DRAFT_681401 [Pisolithus microcarpus]KIK21420.1 hypothetical protein PISMIDRAFT_681401 [Pisolithus microcarpus 441]
MPVDSRKPSNDRSPYFFRFHPYERVGASARERAMATQYTSDDNSLVFDEQGFVPSRQTVVPGSIPRNIIARNLDGAANAIHSVDMSRQKLSSGGGPSVGDASVDETTSVLYTS